MASPGTSDEAKSVEMAEATAVGGGGGVEGAKEVEGDDPKARSDALKALGNTAFKAGQFAEAEGLYSEGIAVLPTAVLYSNRAFCHLKLEAFGFAISDAEEALKLDPTYIKAYYRRGSANMALSKFKVARKDFRHVCKLKPRDKDARAKLDACDKEIQRVRFEEAIAMDSAPPMSQTLDLNSMAVPESYSGPRFEGDTPTEKFAVDAMEYWKNQKTIPLHYTAKILVALLKLLKSLPSLVDVTVPETNDDGTPGVLSVCGDTHGQYYDLLNIFDKNGLPGPKNPYLFNGDFVDRGSFSVENVLCLFTWKLVFPEHVHLTRGNHETINMNKVYGFWGEVKHKYNEELMGLFTEVFDALPLACCINKKALVVHGGLFSKDGVKLDDVRKIKRFQQPPDAGLMTDLMWSDPQPAPGRGPSKRGIGVSFGPDVTDRFLKDNGLDLLVRSHEVKAEGYLVEHGGKCITIFSAPNYCDQMGNKGALIRFGADMKPKFVQFTAVPHPPLRPMHYAMGMGSMFNLA